MKNYLIIITLSAAILIHVTNGNKQVEEKRLLDKILDSKTYDTSIRPLGENSTDEYDGPCIVTANVFIKSIGEIDDHKMEYSMQVTFRQNWKDNRLVFAQMLNSSESKSKTKVKYLSLRDISKIWTPDLFFSNEKESHFHETMTPNNLVRIYPDGAISYSTRISLTLSCPMNLKFFPFDVQTCNIRMASYSYSTDDIVFKWMDTKPVQIVKDLFLPKFELSKHNTSIFVIATKTGKYSGLELSLRFKREYGSYIVQFYIPCALLVIISWLSFWLNQIPTSARLSLVVTNLITLALLIVAINSMLPTVSYVKAIDLYTGVCLMFVIATVFEYTSATLAQFEEEKQQLQQEMAEKAGSSESSILGLEDKSDKPPKNCANIFTFIFSRWCCRARKQKKIKKKALKSQRIDDGSKVMFPLLFFIFVIAYCIGIYAYFPSDDK